LRERSIYLTTRTRPQAWLRGEDICRGVKRHDNVIVGQASPPVLVNWFTLCNGAAGHDPDVRGLDHFA